MSSTNYKPRSGPFESTDQLRDRVKELEAELARSRAEADDRLQSELARRELFESSLLAALRLKGIDLSDMPVATRISHAPRAPTGESQTHADEHSPISKRVRISPATDNSLDDSEDDLDGIC